MATFNAVIRFRVAWWVGPFIHACAFWRRVGGRVNLDWVARVVYRSLKPEVR